MTSSPRIRTRTRLAGRDIDGARRAPSPLVTSALTATSIVDNVRRSARGAT